MIGRHFFRLSKYLIFIAILSITTGCATTQTSDGIGDDDPLETPNRVSFDFNEALDKHVMKPVAEGYVAVTPVVVRTGVTNFFDNLSYLNVILNAFLQGKVGQGFSDMTRFIFNSSFGIGGLFDVATHMGLPEHDEDFGQTLAVWGVDKGAYLYIPLFGPNTIRGSTDFVPNTLLNPFFYVSSIILFPVNALNAVNTRANLLEASNIRDEAALDTYTFTREAYLQQREYLIYDGNPPLSGYDDFFDENGNNISDEVGDSESGVLIIE